MAQQDFNVSLPNDGLGDALRNAFIKQQEMNTELYANKVDKVDGLGLSQNSFTDAEKEKLASIEVGAEVNVQSDYIQDDDTADDYIKNKLEIPFIPSFYQDRIIALGTTTVVDDSAIFSIGFVWDIANEVYQNAFEIKRELPYATVGNYRTHVAYLTDDNNISIQVGAEDTVITPEPAIPIGTLRLQAFNVFGETVTAGEPSIYVLGINGFTDVTQINVTGATVTNPSLGVVDIDIDGGTQSPQSILTLTATLSDLGVATFDLVTPVTVDTYIATLDNALTDLNKLVRVKVTADTPDERALFFDLQNYRANTNLVVSGDFESSGSVGFAGGAFIPLSGTEVGSPITGDVEIQNGVSIKLIQGDPLEDFRVIEFTDENSIKLFNKAPISTEGYSILHISNNTVDINVHSNTLSSDVALFIRENGIFLIDQINGKGLIGDAYYGDNYDDLTYVQKKYVDALIVTASQTAVLERQHNTNGTVTLTDPTPEENKSYSVFVIGGTTTIGGVAYTAGKYIIRSYNGTVWSSRVFVDETIIGSATQTALNSRVEILVNDTTPVATVGGGLQELKAYKIPANKVTKSLTFNPISLTKKGKAGSAVMFAYISNTNNFATATQIARIAYSAANLSVNVKRSFIIDGTTLKGVSFGTGLITDEVALNTAKETTTIDFTQPVYIWFAGQIFGGGDTVGIDGVKITT